VKTEFSFFVDYGGGCDLSDFIGTGDLFLVCDKILPSPLSLEGRSQHTPISIALVASERNVLAQLRLSSFPPQANVQMFHEDPTQVI
jgi:hypothetical protein